VPVTIPTNQNQLLSGLRDEVLASILPSLVLVPLVHRQTIIRQDAAVDFVYFPLAGMLSLVANFEDGVQVEVGVIGREGMFGACLVADVETSFTEVNVQLPGHALRMSARDFRTATADGGELRAISLRFNEALHAQVGQTAACNGHHQLEQRLARWLLTARDRSDADELPLTQEFLAVMLGVHRPSVTVSARILQRAGLISYSRDGRVTILDRAGLESTACECYATVLRRFEILLGGAGVKS
jgi:CRP-like cAMP-binding protein